jgi:hypothetical protein
VTKSVLSVTLTQRRETAQWKKRRDAEPF